MKVIQSGDQLELRSSGIGQLLIGIIFTVIGIGLTILLLTTPSDNGKKAPLWSVLIGLVFIIAGILAAIFAKNRSVVMRKGGDTTVTAKRLFGGAPQQQSVPTASIVAVRLSTYIDNTGNTSSNGSMGNPQNSRRSVLSLVLNNNDIIEAGSSGGKGGFSINGLNVSSLIMKAPLSKEANETANFLGVPLQADDTSSIAGAVRSVKAAFENGQPAQPPAQTTSFNPNPAAPAAPVPTPQAPVPPPQPAQQPQATQPAPPPENPPGPSTPPPPYTPPSASAPQQ